MPIGIALLVAVTTADLQSPGGNLDGTYQLAARGLERELVISEGRLRTKCIRRQADGRTLVVRGSREFCIRLQDGSELTSEQYRVQDVDASALSNGRLKVMLVPVENGWPRLTITFEADDALPVIRKSIDVAGNAPIDRIDVESHSFDTSVTLGGLGQPLYLEGEWFIGLEYPAGLNDCQSGVVRCSHFPSAQSFRSKTAVLGARLELLSVEETFQRYLATIRPEVRPVLMYSSWFDRRGEELTCDKSLEVFELLQEKLLRPNSVSLDYFLLDDGYQAPDSLWQAGRQWPKGTRPLREKLEEQGTKLGLWMPLNGLGLDPSFGRSKGWPLANHWKAFYWLPDSDYQKAIKESLLRSIEEEGAVCFKHDFNVFDALPPRGSNESMTPAQAREAIVDATISVLDDARKRKPEIYQSLTSGVWLSPWWLMHVDALWLGYADYDHDFSFPQGTDRQAEMTYRDEKLYRRLRIEQAQVPASSLMTHGIMRGRYDHTAPEESLETWSDYLVMYFGRGTQLQELYLSPERMPESFWRVLGKAIRWARAHAETLKHSRLIGGQPARGDVYGYVHWSPHEGIFVLRNPSMVPKRFLLDSSERPADLPSPSKWWPVIVYPYQERLEPTDSAAHLSIVLPSQSVTVVHLYEQLPQTIAAIPVGRFELLATTDGGRLRTLAKGREIAIRPATEVVDEKEWWRGAFDVDAPWAEMVVSCAPAEGAMIQTTGIEETSVTRPVGSQPNAWSFHRFSRPPESDGLMGLEVAVPPTPRWPEHARVTAVIRAQIPMLLKSEQVLSADATLPDWPMAIRAQDQRQEMVVLEEKDLYRGRSLLERAGWLLVLGVLPITVAQYGTGRLVRRWGTPVALITRLTVAGGVLAIYLATPLGRWLGHVLLP